MSKGRMEAFSDGVIAVLITIMVLDLHAPQNSSPAALLPLIPVALSYLLSFVFIGIYWNNHHHLLQAIHHVDGRILWANLHLLFWLSLVPFVTAWMGENEFSSGPVALYGVVLLGCAIAFTLLVQALIHLHGRDSLLATALGSDLKSKLSLVLYIAAIPLAFVNSWFACALFAVVAVIWFVPDQRIERRVPRHEH